MESSEQLIKRDEMINQTQSDNPEFNAPTGSFINDQKCVEETKKTFEESKELPKESKSFICVLVGHTGHGKSTFINYLANYFGGGTLENKKVVIPTEYYKLTQKGQTHSERNAKSYLSQTDDCSSYEFRNTKDNCNYTFIDTPGLWSFSKKYLESFRPFDLAVDCAIIYLLRSLEHQSLEVEKPFYLFLSKRYKIIRKIIFELGK
ncbi:unnamed protein product [Blepharisma stoltei]|uniref:Tr-type G domain-containing protein n=1 Tax=Blepharisma stoltei TaxID=1481888 RepID=A0AAU9I9W4_9CILI|nr:unnamed protein product [Blepharisma stoltei]